MTIKRRPVSGSFGLYAASLIFFGLAAWPLDTNAAENAHQIAKKGDVEARTRDIVQGPHVEGHIAFLHAELGITDEQETLWAPVAAAMRQDVENLEEAQDKVAGETHGRLNSLQYLRNRAMFAKLRAQGEERFLKALEPLYQNFSSEQKRAADELLIPKTPDDHQ